MAFYRVQKVVAVTLLEATKTTIDQVGRYRMQLGDNTGDTGRSLATVYGSLRRLRDYLQRCIGAFRDEVEIDLQPEDLPPLTACCKRGAELADEQLTISRDANDRKWLERKRDLLADWAVELAVRPPQELPLPKSNHQSPATRQLDTRLRTKLGAATASAPAPHLALPPIKGGDPVPALQVGRTASPAGMIFTVDEASATPVATEVAPAPATGGNQLLDPKRMRDPRLRSLIALDQRALERAMAADDHRIAAVHLASIVEAVTIDHAMARQQELRLTGNADSWNPQEVLLRILGSGCTPADRAAVHQLFSAYNLIRPVTQMNAPMVVTPASFKRQLAFVSQLLREMGYRS